MIRPPVAGDDAPTDEPTPIGPSATPTAASAACSALLDDVPSTQLNSGEATLAAGYEVNGAQLATYFERLHETTRSADAPRSTWRDNPTKQLTVCVFDGDFVSLTPGPPGHDTSVSRVLVVIEDGAASLWAIALDDRSAIPTTDPATLSD